MRQALSANAGPLAMVLEFGGMTMLDLGGTFTTFLDSILGFVNGLLSAVFSGLSTFFNGLNIF